MSPYPPQPKTTLAEQLKRLRHAHGHPTARGFAKALGISENRYSRYERGEAVPKLELIWAICSELGITPNELYGWDAQPAATSPRSPATPRQDITRSTHRPVAVHGLAEEPASFLQPANGPSLSALDAAAWRVASTLAEALSAPTAGKLAMIRATVEIVSQLKKDPFPTIAHHLQALETSGRNQQIEERLTTEIEAFLAALGADEPRS